MGDRSGGGRRLGRHGVSPLLKTTDSPNCATSIPRATNDSQEDAEVWFLPAPEVAGRTLTGPTVVSLHGENLVDPGLDHPKVAFNPTDPTQAVVTYNMNQGDRVVTVKRTNTGLAPTDRFNLPVGFSFPNPGFDPSGNLYIANDSGGTVALTRFHRASGAWVQDASGNPPSLGPVNHDSITLGSLGLGIDEDPTPAMAIGAIDGMGDPIVYLAYTVVLGGIPRVQISAADTSNLGSWNVGSLASVPSDLLAEFHGGISLDASLATLDLVSFRAEGSAWSAATPITTVFTRFDARKIDNKDFTPALGPVTMSGPAAPAPVVSDLPSRQPKFNSVFIGEYLGVATKGVTSVLGWPHHASSANGNLDLTLGTATRTCGQALTLDEADSIWECSNCGCETSAPTKVVGCVSGSVSDPATVCAQICSGSVCGGAQSCNAGLCSPSAAPVAQKLADSVCNVVIGNLPGPKVASVSDFVATAQGGSTANVSNSQGSGGTTLTGSISFSSPALPPQAGSEIEIARLDVHPQDFHVGGILGADIENIRIVHQARLIGQFTDATHFVIPAGAQIGAEVHVDPDTVLGIGPSPFDQSSLLTTNAPVTGQLDLSAGTFTLDVSGSDNNGGSLTAHFQGLLTQTPPSPLFTFVPPTLDLLACGPATLQQPAAVSFPPGPVTFTNNAPASFACGTTVVTWTATDAARKTATATQDVTVFDATPPSFGTTPPSSSS